MPTTIFYGAGGNAEHGLAQWLGWGLKPVCFVDANPARYCLYWKQFKRIPIMRCT